MKSSDPNSDPRWQELIRRARADAVPRLDQAALLRVVRAAASTTRAGWLDEFVALFPARRVVPWCLTGTAAIAVITTWEGWAIWQALPWAQLIQATAGGVP